MASKYRMCSLLSYGYDVMMAVLMYLGPLPVTTSQMELSVKEQLRQMEAA